MNWSWPRFLLTLLIGLVAMAIYHFALRKRGARYETVYDRVVEETTDESTKIKSLTDAHRSSLKDHASVVEQLHTDHDLAVTTLRNQLSDQSVAKRRLDEGAVHSAQRIAELETAAIAQSRALAEAQERAASGAAGPAAIRGPVATGAVVSPPNRP